MALTSSETQYDSDFGPDSKEKNDVFSKIFCSDLINFIQDLTGWCQ